MIFASFNFIKAYYKVRYRTGTSFTKNFNSQKI